MSLNTSIKKLRSICITAALAVALSLLALMPGRAYAAIDEVEGNNSFETATSISMNQSVYGVIDLPPSSAYRTDEVADYFKVNLPASGTVKVTFVNDKYYNNGWNNRIAMDIFNGYFEPFGDTYFHYINFSTHDTRPNTFTINLKKGDNYFRIAPNTLSDSEDHSYHFKLTYVVPGTTIKKATPAKKAFTVKWTKKSGAAKYQIRYSTKKSMSGAKTVNVSKAAKSKKVKGLKSGKKYYVQVRVAKKVGGQIYYSNWSSKKSVRTK